MLTSIISYLRDYGLFDIVASRINRRKRNRKKDDIHYKKFENLDISGETWICFLPGGISFEKAEKMGLLPQNSSFVAYEIPVGILSPDPIVAKKILQEIVNDFKSNYSHLKKINVLSYSVGQYPGAFIANNFPVKKFVLVGPGNRFGSCLWQGVATQDSRKLAEKRGILSEEEYNKFLEGTNPAENIDNLPSDIEIHLGMYDKYTPTKLGLDYLSNLKKKGKKPKVHRYEGKGHILTFAEFGIRNPY